MDDINRNTNLEEAVIVEWNEHMFSTDLERFPIHPDSPYDPEPRYDDPLAVYLQRLDDDGIDHGVIVQPTPYWDDHSLLLDCLEREPRRLHGTCLFNPQDLDAGRKMVDLVAQQERIIACRFHGLGGMDQPAPATYAAGVLSQWRQALELGLVGELHINAMYARATAAALREMPESTVLIDHLAEPHTTSAVDYADLLDLAGPESEWLVAGSAEEGRQIRRLLHTQTLERVDPVVGLRLGARHDTSDRLMLEPDAKVRIGYWVACRAHPEALVTLCFTDKEGHPAVGLRESGRGRVVAVASRPAWGTNYRKVVWDGWGQYHRAFWAGLMGWVARCW